MWCHGEPLLPKFDFGIRLVVVVANVSRVSFAFARFLILSGRPVKYLWLT